MDLFLFLFSIILKYATFPRRHTLVYPTRANKVVYYSIWAQAAGLWKISARQYSTSSEARSPVWPLYADRTHIWKKPRRGAESANREHMSAFIISLHGIPKIISVLLILLIIGAADNFLGVPFFARAFLHQSLQIPCFFEGQDIHLAEKSGAEREIFQDFLGNPGSGDPGFPELSSPRSLWLETGARPRCAHPLRKPRCAHPLRKPRCARPLRKFLARGGKFETLGFSGPACNNTPRNQCFYWFCWL